MSAHVAQQFFPCPRCGVPDCNSSDRVIATALYHEQIVAMRKSWEQWHILVEINAQARARRQEEARRERQIEEDAQYAQTLVDEDIARRKSWEQWRILVEINAQIRARRQEEARRERQVEEDANVALLLHESLIEAPP